MQKIKYIKLLPILLWTIIICHEIIPHYHPNGNNGEISILLNNENKCSENEGKGDENGILDNIVVVASKSQIIINPIITIIPIICAFSFDFYRIHDLNKSVSCNYYKYKSLPIKQVIYRTSLFRGPPSI